MRNIWFVIAAIDTRGCRRNRRSPTVRVDPTAVKSEDGKYLDKEGNPTYKIAPDGTVDWYTYSGYRRYHSECHTCHGPDGMGSTYAPALKDSLKTMSYGDFLGVVANGRKNVSTAGECDACLRHQSERGLPHGRHLCLSARPRQRCMGPRAPAKHEDKPRAYAAAENGCMGKK